MFWNCRYGNGEHERRSGKTSEERQPENGIQVTVEDNKISLDFHVIVAYGVSISAVADNLINNVKYKVEEFTGMEIHEINIYVEGVRPID